MENFSLKYWHAISYFVGNFMLIQNHITVMDQKYTGIKLWGPISGHIIATFHILSKFANTTKSIPHSTGLFKSFSRAGSPLQ